MEEQAINGGAVEPTATELDPQFDAAANTAWEVPASPDDYRFSLPHLNRASLEDIATSTTAFKTAAHRMGLPVSIARHMAEEISRGIAKHDDTPLDAAALAVGAEKSRAILERMYGPATVDQMLRDVAEMIRRADNPELEEVISISGLANSPWLISTLSNVYRASRGR